MFFCTTYAQWFLERPKKLRWHLWLHHCCAASTETWNCSSFTFRFRLYNLCGTSMAASDWVSAKMSNSNRRLDINISPVMKEKQKNVVFYKHETTLWTPHWVMCRLATPAIRRTSVHFPDPCILAVLISPWFFSCGRSSLPLMGNSQREWMIAERKIRAQTQLVEKILPYSHQIPVN